MGKRTQFLTMILAGIIILTLVSVYALNLATPATAGPLAQNGQHLPTPTLPPIPDSELMWSLDVVGGDDSPQVFPGETVDGLTFGETTAEQIQRNVVFYIDFVDADSDTSKKIYTDQFHIRYKNRAKVARGSWPDEVGIGQGLSDWPLAREIPWPLAREIPAWTEIEFQWGASVEGNEEPVFSSWQSYTLVDPANEWFRVENDYAILYWYGFGENQTEQIANQFTRAIALTHTRLLDGFGHDISFKPIFVIYPDEPSLQQVLDWELEAGHVSHSAIHGMSVIVLAPTQTETLADCPLLPPSEYSEEYRLRWTIEANTTSGLIHQSIGEILRQPFPGESDVGWEYGSFGWEYVNHGPYFWWYGQARWFTHTSFGDWSYEERVKQVATEYGVKPLRLMSLYSDYYTGPDGCPGFLGDVGASFINWLVHNYGIETHRQIVELMIPTGDVPRGMDFYDAIEQATGKPFDDLEDEWRAYLRLLSLHAQDPDAAYQEALDRIQQAKDTGTTELSLRGLGLAELPSEIGQLASLQSLDLMDNDLTSLPSEIGQLTSLQSLNLVDNDLTSLPPEIGQLTNLRELSLGFCSGKCFDNNLTGLPPEIGQLTNLKTLGLSSNQLADLPPEIGQLTNLRGLYLDDNNLTSLPPEIGRLTNLRALTLTQNQLADLPPEIDQLSSLQQLSLGDNYLTSLPPEIGQLYSLQQLYLDGNYLTSLPPEIGQLANLETLWLARNQLANLPPEIGQLTKLQTLDVSGNALTSLPYELSQMPILRELDVSDNPLASPPPEIVRQGTEEILTYLRGQLEDKGNE